MAVSSENWSPPTCHAPSRLETCEDEESMVGAEGECGFVRRRRAASAPLDQICRIKRSAKTRAAASVVKWPSVLKLSLCIYSTCNGF